MGKNAANGRLRRICKRSDFASFVRFAQSICGAAPQISDHFSACSVESRRVAHSNLRLFAKVTNLLLILDVSLSKFV